MLNLVSINTIDSICNTIISNTVLRSQLRPSTEKWGYWTITVIRATTGVGLEKIISTKTICTGKKLKILHLRNNGNHSCVTNPKKNGWKGWPQMPSNYAPDTYKWKKMHKVPTGMRVASFSRRMESRWISKAFSLSKGNQIYWKNWKRLTGDETKDKEKEQMVISEMKKISKILIFI